MSNLAILGSIIDLPATDLDLGIYVKQRAQHPTPKILGSLLARVRQDNARIEELEEALKEARGRLDDTNGNTDLPATIKKVDNVLR